MDPAFPPAGKNEPPVQAMLAPLAAQTAATKPRSAWPRFLLLLLFLVFLGSLILNLMLISAVGLTRFGGLESDARIREQFVSGDRSAADTVAVFSIEGTILSGEGFFRRQLNHAHKEWKAGRLKALVLRVNSPGGTINGSDYMYHHLKEFRQETKIPIVVSMGALAASGGYYVSMAVGDKPETIFAEPTTWTGSIGVIIPHYNLAGTMEKLGIQEDNITSGPLKDMGSFFRPLNPEEKKVFEDLVDEGFQRFKEVIREGRPRFEKDPEALDKIATGQVFTAEQAKENGLVDQIGYLEEAVDQATAKAGLRKEDVKVVRYRPEPSLADVLFGNDAKAPMSPDLAQFLEATTPRAYYLCTWLPGLGATPMK
ncbi:MAG: signal peptide peptidase SppA [Pirellulales bacterium]|nr:signal peptide peptidase SppA [Pirellulales bacterium]